MAIIECRECNKEVSDVAQTCPNCGIQTPSQVQYDENISLFEIADKEAKTEEWIENGFKIAGILLVIWLIFSGKAAEWFFGVAKDVVAACEVEKLNIEPDIFIINGEADWGIKAVARIRKTERNGEVTVKVKISSSEGNLERERSVRLNAGQIANVVIRFHEPTINAVDINGQANCNTL